MKRKVFLYLILVTLLVVVTIQIKTFVFAEQSGSSPESGVTSRIKTIYNSLVTLTHGSESAGSWGNWGVMWNRIRSAGEWVPAGDADEADVASGKTFYKDSRTIKTGTATLAEPCAPFTVNHVASGGVAPINKTITYGVVRTSIAGTGEKCWITQNLGAYNQAAAATDNTEASAGWYFQFNRKQGYQYTASRTPATAWDATNDNTYTGWDPAKDPCTLELGSAWRLPTYAEYLAADGAPQNWANRNDTYASVLKLHSVGVLDGTSGVLFSRGGYGAYWSSTQSSVTNGWFLDFDGSNSGTYNYNTKSCGIAVRCLRDP